MVTGKAVAASPAAQKRPLTNLERVKRIEEVVEREIRPWLRNDGGDIEIIDIDRAKVTVALRGTCSNCFSLFPSLASLFALSLAMSASNPSLTSVVFAVVPVNSAARSRSSSSMLSVVLMAPLCIALCI